SGRVGKHRGKAPSARTPRECTEISHTPDIDCLYNPHLSPHGCFNPSRCPSFTGHPSICLTGATAVHLRQPLQARPLLTFPARGGAMS
ncbi:hypothetical protein INR49_031989, partial [Caranx melampygus]